MPSRKKLTLSVDEQRSYSPTVQRLLGILPSDVSIEDYHKHLDEQHSL